MCLKCCMSRVYSQPHNIYPIISPGFGLPPTDTPSSRCSHSGPGLIAWAALHPTRRLYWFKPPASWMDRLETFWNPNSPKKGLKAFNTLSEVAATQATGCRFRCRKKKKTSKNKISDWHLRLRLTCTQLTPAPSASGQSLPGKEDGLGTTSAGTLFPDLLAQMIAFSTSVDAATNIAIWWRHS